MTTLYIVLLALALACFLASVSAASRAGRPWLVPLGLALWVTVPLVQLVRAA